MHLDLARAWTLSCFFLLINELADGWLISGPPRSYEKDGTLAHVATVSSNHGHDRQFVRITFTDSKIKFTEVNFAFLEAEAIDGRDWQRDWKLDWSETDSCSRMLVASKRISFHQ
jgi:hypothetical protein